MNNFVLLGVVVLVLIGIGNTNAAPQQEAQQPQQQEPQQPQQVPQQESAPAAPAASPMFDAHDFASGKLQQRRTIDNGGSCDSDFGSQLEAIVNEMEQNKEAPEELANKLRTQFTEIMDKNSEKQLCVKDSWCDMGVCKIRSSSKMMGRGLEDALAGAAEKVLDKGISKGLETVDKKLGASDTGTSATTEKSSGISTTSVNFVGIALVSIFTVFANN